MKRLVKAKSNLNIRNCHHGRNMAYSRLGIWTYEFAETFFKLVRGFQLRAQWQQGILKWGFGQCLPTYHRDALKTMIKVKVIGLGTILK